MAPSPKTLRKLVEGKYKIHIACIVCGTEVRRKREHQKFCSTKCRLKYHNNVTAQARRAWLDQDDPEGEGENALEPESVSTKLQ